MAMELFMYLIYFAYMKKLDCPQLTSLFRACNVNVAFGFFSPGNAPFLFSRNQVEESYCYKPQHGCRVFPLHRCPFIC
jgi:hypothetical protein